MFCNRMTVQVTVKCGECPRTGTTAAQLCPGGVGGETVLRSDSMPLPADWRQIQVDGSTTEIFCPICAKEPL